MSTETRSDPTIIDGTAIAATMYAEFRSAAVDLAERGLTPGLAVVLVGDDPASSVYVRNKIRRSEVPLRTRKASRFQIVQ
jgi:methylenetetrahydrofolate dehydrogenase (NADP+)/methenyltetrahydrofolate cyclohydrolase